MFPQKVNTLTLSDPDYPEDLRQIHSPPEQLFWLGAHPKEWLDRPKIAIVGSRKISTYGRLVTTEIASQLARNGVVIISGLALGLDAVAHQAALENNGLAVAVLPTNLENISPVSNQHLARQIINSGGSLISEYASSANINLANFVMRNRIISGLADAVLIPEAALKSGSLHTARFALEQGKTVMTVPGNINSETSVGCNNLIKSGALAVTNADDVLFALNISPAQTKKTIFRGNSTEEMVLDLIGQGVDSQEEIALVCQLDGPAVTSALTMLEIAGQVRPLGSGRWIKT